jgi:E3 ubiquitin-protein ligase CHFR
MPFRALQLVVDSLLRHAPHKARTEREREQADEVYKANYTIRVSLTQCLKLHIIF